MKKTSIVMLFAALATLIHAQTDDKGYQEGAWVLKGVTGVNTSQTAMSNWSAGGENSIAGNTYLNASLTHKIRTLAVGHQHGAGLRTVQDQIAGNEKKHR